MDTWVLVVAADLKRDKGTVAVGPETARVLRKAAKEAKAIPGARLCMTAGRSPRYNVSMGSGPMRTYLQETCGIESGIVTPSGTDAPFTTNGEMMVFADMLFKRPERRPHIRLVVRWWHAPRARALLKARLRENAVRVESISVVPVWSLDLLGIVREPLAWLKNIPNLK